MSKDKIDDNTIFMYLRSLVIDITASFETYIKDFYRNKDLDDSFIYSINCKVFNSQHKSNEKKKPDEKAWFSIYTRLLKAMLNETTEEMSKTPLEDFYNKYSIEESFLKGDPKKASEIDIMNSKFIFAKIFESKKKPTFSLFKEEVAMEVMKLIIDVEIELNKFEGKILSDAAKNAAVEQWVKILAMRNFAAHKTLSSFKSNYSENGPWPKMTFQGIMDFLKFWENNEYFFKDLKFEERIKEFEVMKTKLKNK